MLYGRPIIFVLSLLYFGFSGSDFGLIYVVGFFLALALWLQIYIYYSVKDIKKTLANYTLVKKEDTQDNNEEKTNE